MTATQGRTLDYRPRLDPRNRAFRVSAADPALLQRPRYWTPGVVLDQGQEGSCVGHGVVGEYLASPVRGRLAQPTPEPTGVVWGSAELGHLLAVGVYDRAKGIDEFEGVDYDGTSVRAGMFVARERGWVSGFRWAFSMLELRAALEEGPVVIGIQVRERMWETEPNGDWIPEGPEVGWHCVLLTSYSPNYYGRGPRYVGPNSWSLDWGRRGRFAIAPEHLDSILFQSGGEAAVPSGRHL